MKYRICQRARTQISLSFLKEKPKTDGLHGLPRGKLIFKNQATSHIYYPA